MGDRFDSGLYEGRHFFKYTFSPPFWKKSPSRPQIKMTTNAQTSMTGLCEAIRFTWTICHMPEKNAVVLMWVKWSVMTGSTQKGWDRKTPATEIRWYVLDTGHKTHDCTSPALTYDIRLHTDYKLMYTDCIMFGRHSKILKLFCWSSCGKAFLFYWWPQCF